MMKMRKNIFWLLFLLLWACTQEETAEESTDIFPGLFNLVYPENGSACLDGVTINKTQSKVTFIWNSSKNANQYEIEIINLNDNYTQTFQSNEKTIMITLKHGEPYAWSVTAKVANGLSITSKEWKFYLAGNGIINYAPFPPELITPRPSARVNLNSDGQVILNWTCSDVDDDLESYKVYMDKNDGSTLVRTLTNVESTMELAVDAASGHTYFWKIIATDKEGNSASSGVYSFLTQ